jgi:hypothetical protein
MNQKIEMVYYLKDLKMFKTSKLSKTTEEKKALINWFHEARIAQILKADKEIRIKLKLHANETLSQSSDEDRCKILNKILASE